MTDGADDTLASLFDRVEPVESDVDALDGRVVAFADQRKQIKEVVQLLAEGDGPPTILFATPDAVEVCSRWKGWFEVATRVSDLVESGTLVVRETPLTRATPTVVGDERAGVLVSLFGNQLSCCGPADLHAGLAELVAGTEPYDPPVPSIDTIFRALRQEFDASVAADFTAATETAFRSEDDVDGLQLFVLVAAVHQLRWSTLWHLVRDVGVASDKILRERKDQLLSRGLICERPDTEYDGPGQAAKQLHLPEEFDVAPDDGVPDLLLRQLVVGG